jgi:hypothetical protein
VQIRAGFDIAFQCVQETPMVLMLSIEPARVGDLLSEHRIKFSPDVASHDYVDMFGNTCTRIVAPAGLIEMRNDFLIADSGLPDAVAPDARQIEVSELPDDVLIHLLGSRYCDTEKLSDLAWSLFGAVTPGWPRVQAICDYAHERISFGYHHARSDRTASEGHDERIGVCRDFAHLAVTLCRRLFWDPDRPPINRDPVFHSMSVRFVPFLQIDIAVLVLLLFFDLGLPRLIRLLGVGPISMLAGIVVGLLFAHADTSLGQPRKMIGVPRAGTNLPTSA